MSRGRDLPRETRKILPKQTACPDCGGQLEHLGEDVSEMLEWVPASFKVIRQVAVEAGLWALRQDRAGRSTEPADRAERLVRDFWRTCWWRSIAITYRLYRQEEVYADPVQIWLLS